MELLMHRLLGANNQILGYILTVMTNERINAARKQVLEDLVIRYVHDVLYAGHAVNIYRNTNNDTASITVIADINALPQETRHI